jgi:hypothetical protein
MGSWETTAGSWVYADDNTRVQVGDEANASTDGQAGAISASAEAKSKKGKSSSAKASWSATYTGKRTWKANNANDLPTEETMPAFSVTYTPNWTVAVDAADGEKAEATASAQLALQIGGVNKNTQTVVQQTLDAPPSDSQPKTQPTQSITLQSPSVKHKADITYGVTISVSASASRTGEECSGKAVAGLTCSVVDPV